MAVGLVVAVALLRERSLHLREAGVDELANRRELGDLDGIVIRQPAERLEILGELGAGFDIRIEVGRVLRQQEAALARFRVDGPAVDPRDEVRGVLGVIDPVSCVPELGEPALGGPVRDEPNA